MAKQTCTVLVTVLEGHNFLRKQSSKIYVQCKFNTEILTTNPTLHESTPIWDTELAWEVEARALSYLKSQRATLKLVVHSIDNQNRRDTLGYIILDLRAASQKALSTEKWYPLINSKLGGAFRPEIKLAFCVSLPSETIPSTIVRSRPPKALSSMSESLNLKRSDRLPQLSIPYKQLDPTCYQLNGSSNIWVFSITIAFAENLALLYNDALSQSSQSSSPDFYFRLKFLNSSFDTERFNSLDNPVFSAKSFCITFQSSKGDLIAMMRELSRCAIYLHRGDTVLGVAYVPTESLVQTDSLEQFPVIENVFNIFDANESLPISHDSKVPNLGLSLAITGSDEGNKSNQPGKFTKDMEPDSKEIKSPNLSRQYSPKPGAITSPKKISAAPIIISAPQEDINERPVPVPKSAWKAAEPDRRSNLKNWKQYRFSIDLLEVLDFQLPDSTIFMKYLYVPFGSSSSVKTSSSLVQSRNQSNQLRHSFSAFEFIMGVDRLKTYLEGVPLVIKVFSIDPMGREQHLGSLSLDMSQVLKAPKRQPVDEDEGGKDTRLQTCEVVSIITGTEAQSYRKIGDMKLVLVLEDFGEIETELDLDQYQEETQVFADSIIDPARIREDLKSVEYEERESKSSLEMELFQKNQEQKYKDLLIEKERELIAKLSAQCSKRDADREKILKQKLQDFKKLELEMNRLLEDLEDREHKLHNKDNELIKRSEDLERQYQRKAEESRDTSRRLHEEYKYQAELDQKRCKENEFACQRALSQKKDIESRYVQLDKDYVALRLSLNQSPDTSLKTELLRLEGQNEILRKSVETAEKSKKNYKQLYAKTLRELGHVKKERQNEVEETVLKERREFETIKLKQFAKEELKKDSEDERILQDIKSELQQLRHHSFGKPAEVAIPNENIDPETLHEIEQLTRERRLLLETGVYNDDDAIIAELKHRIQNLRKS